MASEAAQCDLFDPARAARARDLGIKRVSARCGGWVARARHVARMIALERGSVTADEVRAVIYARGDKPAHHNAWGAVFRGMRWTGEFRKSALVQGHGNLQRVWTL